MARSTKDKADRPEKLTARQKRQLRDKRRRERLIRQRPPGAKEKFVSGCLAFGIVAFVTLLGFLTWTCFFTES